MKRKLKRSLILVFLALASLFIFAGCSFRYTTRQDVIDDYDLEAAVTYYANGGVFENNLDTKTIDYVSGQPAINIGEDKTTPQRTIKRDEYDFNGWYHVILDSEGKPTYTDETQKYYALGEEVDFTVNLEKGDHWHIAASWRSKTRVQFKLVVDEGAKIPNPDKNAEQKEFANGDVFRSAPFNGDGTYPYPSEYFDFNPSDFTRAFTFVEYYADEACTTLATWPAVQQDTDVVVYAKYLVGAWTVVKDKAGVPFEYLEGEWTIVRDDEGNPTKYIEGNWTIVKTPQEVVKMFRSIAYNEVKGDGYWIYQDIDMSNTVDQLAPILNFNTKIHSEGASIKNLKVSKSSILDKTTTSVFGKIGDKAEIVNVNFENLTFACASSNQSFNAYFIFESLSDKAKIENVTVSGTLELTISKSNGTYVANLMDANLVMNYTNYLFGGYETDEAYVTASGGNGFKVLGAHEEIVKVEQSL